MKLPRQPPSWPLAVALSMIPFIVGLVTASSHHHNQNRHEHHHQLHLSHVPEVASNVAYAKSSSQDLSPRFLQLQSHVDLKNLASDPSDSAGQDDFTCGPNKPCSNGACCGDSGWCGYGPTYCGDGCQSHCDAVAECGQYASDPDAGCPLNVCCSQFGFCGTTSDFCGKGCQSNCEQPKPSGPSTDVQQRIIGYWEAWNSQHPCGSMNVGEIPVTYLTHLNVAFGYISQDFKVTNMDGVSSDIYRNVGNLKARNPSLKIVISLGGWSFNDPGPWRTVFPTLVSSSANRATFIQNLLGFLSEYGYDGVDFDWEYPGAKDRGGSDADAANYVALLKELREAITSSGSEYIVTFTAPTSYWYLKHFDIKGMEAYVDWINLMSYDLHGVWDSSDPIGSQVLAHTNLTEIDMALDLFWRAEIEPSSIVLGLAFYGRTFNLKSSSCWKPGCAFDGPGAAGKCTGTAGILSYREIQDILRDTGATSYLDKDAAVRYLVYGQNSWVSYDDQITFRAKIDYANKIGLSGLLVWAIDLDGDTLDALRAISGINGRGSADAQSIFSLVDLKNLFPKELLPSSDAKLAYGLVPFGSSGDLSDPSPTSGPFGFLLIASDSHVVTNLKKRDNQSEPMVFLDCPESVKNRAKGKTHVARVTCFSDDVKGCFRVMEGGVEGTVVQMPENCASTSFGRAISLKLSADQSLPSSIGEKNPTSPVFDFTFDFDLSLMRRDTNNTRIRLDYSNARGYWDRIVNSPGIDSDDPNSLKARFYAPGLEDWDGAYNPPFVWEPDATVIREKMDAALLWETVEECEYTDDVSTTEGFGAFVHGNVDAKFWYGVSIVATYDAGFRVHQAHGFLKAAGQTDLTYEVAGDGEIDISEASQGNPAWTTSKNLTQEGHVITVSDGDAVINVTPYLKLKYQMGTIRGENGTDLTNSRVSFKGRMSTRTITDLGDFEAEFPSPINPKPNQENSKREKNKISIPDRNVIYGSDDEGGQIVIGTDVSFGLHLNLLAIGGIEWSFGTPKMELTYNTLSTFSFSPQIQPTPQHGEVCSSYTVITDVYQRVENEELLGWQNITNVDGLVYDSQKPTESEGCYAAQTSPGAGSQIMDGADINDYFVGSGLSVMEALDSKPAFSSSKTMTCRNVTRKAPCCGCTSLYLKYGLSDLPPCDECDPVIPDDDSTDATSLSKRSEQVFGQIFHLFNKRVSGKASLLSKEVKFCNIERYIGAPYRYPSFPNIADRPWENIENNKWDPISRYWGNASHRCDDWTVARLQDADTEFKDHKKQRAGYQTEHVYEGQLIGAFFSHWLSDGRVNGPSIPVSPQTVISCRDIEVYVVNDLQYTVYKNVKRTKTQQVPFAKYLLTELGNESHLDRLAIALTRINGKKGRLFSGVAMTGTMEFMQKNIEEQLLDIKEIGMVFEYINDPAIWTMYCATYEALWKLMPELDAEYTRRTGVFLDFQNEWAKYNREVLVTAEASAQRQYRALYASRKIPRPGSAAEKTWKTNQSSNFSKLKIKGVCNNM